MLIKSGTQGRNIKEFYQSKWYEGYTNEAYLRYFHLKYLMPDMRVSVDDAHGYDFRFQIGYDRGEDWYNYSRIYSVDSIKLKRVPNCERRDYFYLWVTQEVPKKYWSSVTGKSCWLDVNGNPQRCFKSVKQIGRIIKPKGKLAKKVACNTSCLRLCNKPFLRDVPITDSCSQELIEFAFNNAIMGYSKYIADKASEFDRLYKNKCMQAVEHTTMVVPHLQYHYTLYYYDQAGQLIKTVPPEGIDIDDRNIFASQRQSMCDNRHATAVAHRSNNSNPKAVTGHWLVTNYEFNTLSQAAWQKTPDAGVSEFYYDILGRIVVSQNSKQAASATAKRYSYTRFDNLGRIAEVGEYTPTGGRTINAEKAANPTDLSTFFDNYTTNADFKEVTLSIYDIPSWVQNQTALTAAFDGAAQDNLRTRVASTYLYETLPIGSGGGMGLITNMASGSTALNGYSSATHYTYDIHGNVFTLVQDIPYLSRFNRQFFRMKYKYDLLSGNVHRVEYQPGSQDALYHKYLYDLDNRLTRVFTSRDDAHWEQDAKYYYYLHGPLMRTELGELKVQGLDYAYTMHGWLKSVNGPSLEKNKDMGRDGDYTLTSNLHTDVAKDAFAFGLDYYEGDFNSVNNSQILPQTTGGDIHPYLKDLFNGNIRSMLTSLPDVNQYKTRNIQSHTLGFVYRYDQLNRIKEMRTFDNLNYASNQWDGSSAPLDGTERYFTDYNYDAMGNITHLKRIANQSYLPPGVAPIGTMDDLSYSYTYDVNNHLVHNRLGRVQDAVSTPYTEDLETQSAGNYTYDETGNLITDAGEQIQNIAWNVYGKIRGITRSGGTKPELEYGYGPGGQRINKTVIPQTGGNREQEKKWSRTWYIRDASGNTMATYTQAVHENKHAITHAVINTIATFTLAEQHLYGAARLGYTELNRLMDSAVLNTPGYNSNQSFDNYTWQAVTVNTLATPYDYAWGGNWNLLNGRGITRGYKRYELSNHLGNIAVTVSDRHLAVDAGGTTLADYFQPFVQSVQDYFPFGSSLPGREWKVSRYRYAINTQEKEPELGDGMSSAEFWMYDGKLGRRWNVDPRSTVYFSVYSCFGNNPIAGTDKYGDTTDFRNEKGELMYTINDGLEREVIIANDSYLDIVKQFISQGIDDLEELNETARVFRDPKLEMFSNTFEMYLRYKTLSNGLIGRITKETEQEMKTISAKANNYKPQKEIAFLFTTDENKIIHLTELAMDPGGTVKIMDFSGAVFETYAGDNKLATQALINALGWGHVHPSDNLNGGVTSDGSALRKLLYLNEPTIEDVMSGKKTWADYEKRLLSPDFAKGPSWENANYRSWQNAQEEDKRGSIALIVSEYGFVIYWTDYYDSIRVPSGQDYYLYQK
ncbi:MAG: hypothetical protein IT244_11000 [Bacteroidia bacterium]|nr:hypothetical protein [Bacteroidia bacterium]